MGFSRLQGYQGYKRGMQGQDSQGYKAIKATGGVCRDGSRVVNRIKFHFPVSECYNRVDNRIGNIVKIIG